MAKNIIILFNPFIFTLTASIWIFSRVDNDHTFLPRTLETESFITPITAVWFFSGMHFQMIPSSQCIAWIVCHTDRTYTVSHRCDSSCDFRADLSSDFSNDVSSSQPSHISCRIAGIDTDFLQYNAVSYDPRTWSRQHIHSRTHCEQNPDIFQS